MSGITGNKTKRYFKRHESQIDRMEVKACYLKKKTVVCGEWLYVSGGKVYHDRDILLRGKERKGIDMITGVDWVS